MKLRGRRNALMMAAGIAVLAAIGGSFAGAPRAAVAAGPESLLNRVSESTRSMLTTAAPTAHVTLERARPASRVNYAVLDARLQRLMAQPDMVGLSVAVVENGRITFMRGYGVADAAAATPVDQNTVFRWASLSKGVAATMVAELAAEGRLSLSDPVSKWAPSLKLPGGAENIVTVADLLAHRVGLPKNAFDGKLEGGVSPVALRGMLATVRSTCAPATCHSYQNVAFDAAAEIVERVTGRPYADVVRDRLFRPLGMQSASLTRDGLIGSANWARPHVGRTAVPVLDSYYRVPAAGGVNSSIADLAHWMVAQMGGAPMIVPAGVLDEIHRPRIATDRHNGTFNRAMTDQNYGLGWRSYTYAGHRLVGHQGAVRGYRSTILFDPALKSGIAMLWNSSSGKPFAVPLDVADMFYGLPGRDWAKLDIPVTASAAVGTP